ncbi:hypothetical protein COO60DRAFT_1505729 [Scenedesmus sp. NREL 46B-D3]|nr:hypothetical protein COO60DRAFT_1505729 [Scenedesmus sp. NREL 46B-D3]
MAACTHILYCLQHCSSYAAVQLGCASLLAYMLRTLWFLCLLGGTLGCNLSLVGLAGARVMMIVGCFRLHPELYFLCYPCIPYSLVHLCIARYHSRLML